MQEVSAFIFSKNWLSLDGEKKEKNIVVGCVYRHPSKDCANCHNALKEQLCNLNNKGKAVLVLGDIIQTF